MKVKGILMEDHDGGEFLVTLRDSTTAGRPSFIVERRERGVWVSAQLPPRQTVTITAMALMGLSAVMERCGLKLAEVSRIPNDRLRETTANLMRPSFFNPELHP